MAPCGTNALLSSHLKNHETQAIEATLQSTLLPDLPKAHDAYQNRVVNHLSGKLTIGAWSANFGLHCKRIIWQHCDMLSYPIMLAVTSIQISIPFRPLTTPKNRASHSPRQLFAAKLTRAAKPFCTVSTNVTSRCRVPAAVTPKENAEPTTLIVMAEE